MSQPLMSIVIPAYNEERVLGRLLDKLVTDDSPDGLEVVVVCNGCTDGSARVAASGARGIQVVETPVPSKHEALRLGDKHVSTFPRVYVDADVEVGIADLRALAAVFADGTVLAAAPDRRIDLTASSWPVRWFYDVWLRLPGVREGLYGRGVIALSEDGWQRIAELPPLMGDDLAVSALFAPQERRIVKEATVLVHPPRNWGDLIRRRVRAATSTAQFEQSAGRPRETAPTRTSKADLLHILRAEPRLALRVVLFMAVAAESRRKARRSIRDADFTTWLRDTSSRD
jgi:glycosyltransferase involved in cell wall biosynthesis